MGTARILHVVWTLGVGGIETYVVNLLRTCDRARLQMDICCVGGETGTLEDEARRLGSTVYVTRFKRPASYFRFMKRLLREGRYDAVCDYTGDFAGVTILAAWMAGTPRRVVFYRSTGWGAQLGPLKRTVPLGLRLVNRTCATSILGNSHAVLNSFFGRTRGGKLAVIHNGVDSNLFRPDRPGARERIRAELGIPAEAPVLGHVGGFRPPKNHATILRVTKIVREHHPAVRLMLVGEGSLRDRVVEQIDSMDLARTAIVTGVRHDIPDLLCAMDVFVFPSFREGFPNAAVEAQASGHAVVGSDLPEMREVIVPHNHDLLADPADVERMQAAVMRLLGDAEERRGRGALAREFVVRNFSPAANRAAFLAHLGLNGAC